MDLRTLRTFATVARLKGFSAAARALNTVQPAVSRQIADLESELGVALLWRSTREVRVTAAGEILLREAEAMLAHEERARKLVQRAGQGQVGRLRIGFIGSASQPFLSDLIRRFKADRPEVQVSLLEMTAGAQAAALIDGQLEVCLSRPFAFVTLPPDKLGRLPIYVDRLMAYVSQTHPHAGATDVALGDLSGDPFVLFQRDEAPGLFDRVIRACQKAGFSPDIAQQPNSMQAVLTAVSSGLGVSIAPGCIRHLPMSGGLCLPLRGAPDPIPYELYYRADQLQPPTAAFLEVVRYARDDIRARMEV